MAGALAVYVSVRGYNENKMVGAKYRGVIPCSSSKGAVIVNRVLRDENGRRESAVVGARRVSPVSGRQVGIPSERVTDREISGLSGLNLSVPDPDKLSLDILESGQISTSSLIPGVVMSPTTTNGASGLIVTGFEINSTDLVGSGNGDRPAGSSEIVKDDGVPASTIYRRSVSKDNELPEVSPDSGVLNVSEFGNPDSIVGGYGGSSLDAIEGVKERANGNTRVDVILPTRQGVTILPEEEVSNDLTVPAVMARGSGLAVNGSGIGTPTPIVGGKVPICSVLGPTSMPGRFFAI